MYAPLCPMFFRRYAAKMAACPLSLFAHANVELADGSCLANSAVKMAAS
jgi:hypothetical protein